MAISSIKYNMPSCCVEGCRNFTCHSGSGSTDSSIFFHLFPKIKEMKKRWLRAINRPDWDPPDNAHVCSAHFSPQQWIQVKENVWGIKKDAYPDIVFPMQVNNETIFAAEIKVCRMCLASDGKMFSLNNEVLKTCIETIDGLHKNHDVEGLPQFVCYLCAKYLLKTNSFIEKSMIAQATLLEIHADNLRITESLIKEQNREKLNLVHSLQQFNSTPMKVFEFVYDDDKKVSVLTKTSNINNIKQEMTRKKRSVLDLKQTKLKDKNYNILCKKLKKEEDIFQDTNDESPIGKDVAPKKCEKVVQSKIGLNKNVNKNISSVKGIGFITLKVSSNNDNSDSDRTMMGSISSDDVDDIKTEEDNFLSVNDHEFSSDDNIEKTLQKNDKLIRSKNNVPKTVDAKKKSRPKPSVRLKKQNIRTKSMQNKEKEYPLQKDGIVKICNVQDLLKSANTNHRCDACGLAFSSDKSKRVHTMQACMHKGKVKRGVPEQKSTTCLKCKVNFSTTEELNVHKEKCTNMPQESQEEVITNELFYKCHVCEENFRHYTSLEQHFQNVHLKLSEQRNLAESDYYESSIKSESIVDDIIEEYLELDEDEIDESNFKLTKIHHVSQNKPIVINKGKYKNGDRKSKVIVNKMSNKKEYLELKCEFEYRNSKKNNEYQEVESLKDSWSNDEEESLNKKALESEEETLTADEEIINIDDDDETIYSGNKDEDINPEFLDDDDVYEELEVLELDELEENIDL